MANETRNLLGQMLSDVWWLVLLRGITATLLGILLFTQTAATLTVIMAFVGAYWLVDGFFTVLAAIKGRKHLAHWGLGILVGVISILAGAAVLGRPAMGAIVTTTLLIYLVGFMAIFSGVSSIITGLRLRKEIDNEWSMIVGGLLHMLFGLLLVFNPLVSMLVLLYFIGALSIVGGITLIVLALQIRKAGTKVAGATA